MGEDALAETRLAISAQRTELERTADQLREALDVRKRFAENPALFVGVGAGAVFLLAGGPGRAARFVAEHESATPGLPTGARITIDQRRDDHASGNGAE